MKKSLLTFSILHTLYAILHAASPAHAVSSRLAISPPVIEILLAPNKKIVHAFNFTNQGESSEFVANLHQIIPTDSHGHSAIDPTPLDPSTIPLVITLANADRELGQPFSVDSGNSTQLVLAIESASVDITIDSYLALVISPIATTTSLDTTSTTIPGISALILTTLTPDGIIPIDLAIEDFDLPLIHDSTTPLIIPAKLTNSSDIMIRPQSTLIIDSPQQSRSEEIILDPNLILSHSSRTLTTDSQSLIYYPSWYHIGPHNLTLNVTTEGGSQITTVTKSIWLLPIRALIITILIALITTYLLLSARKHNDTNGRGQAQPLQNT